MSDYVIYESGENICPDCGGIVNVDLTGDVLNPSRYTEYYDCECRSCGKRFSAESADELSLMYGSYNPLADEFTWRCELCGNVDTAKGELHWGEDVSRWYCHLQCGYCHGHAYAFFKTRHAGTMFYDSSGRPLKSFPGKSSRAGSFAKKATGFFKKR